jgi:hypothetical protein
VVGARNDVNAGQPTGAVWVLFLAADGTVKSYRRIAGTESGSAGAFAAGFGGAVAALGDLDGDGVEDIAVGARGDDDGAQDSGAVWVLFLAPDGTVRARQKISRTQGGFTGHLDSLDTFGTSLAAPGDLDGDGVADLVVGAVGDDDGGNSRGALWELFLAPDGTVKGQQKISATTGGFTGVLADGDGLGTSVAGLGDLDGDGNLDLAVGAQNRRGTFGAEGAVWVLFLAPDGTVARQQEISSSAGGFTGTLDFVDFFGSALANLGDLDGDGTVDLGRGFVRRSGRRQRELRPARGGVRVVPRPRRDRARAARRSAPRRAASPARWARTVSSARA